MTQNSILVFGEFNAIYKFFNKCMLIKKCFLKENGANGKILQ